MKWRRRKSVVNFRQQIWFSLELVAVAFGFVIICAFFLFIPGDLNSQALLDDFVMYVFRLFHYYYIVYTVDYGL